MSTFPDFPAITLSPPLPDSRQSGAEFALPPEFALTELNPGSRLRRSPGRVHPVTSSGAGSRHAGLLGAGGGAGDCLDGAEDVVVRIACADALAQRAGVLGEGGFGEQAQGRFSDGRAV